MTDTPLDPGSMSDTAFLEEERRDAVVRLLESARIGVVEGFADSVMASLSHRPRRRLPLAAAAAVAAALLALASALLLAGSREAGVAATTVGALARLASSALLAGAGLLGASWSFLSLPARAALGESPLASAATAAALLGLAFLLWRALRRRRAAVGVAAAGHRRRR